MRHDRSWPLLRLGFRPFYLAGAAFALISIPLWLLMWFGITPHQPALAPLLWHGHEILYGFAVAVIVGFLLTAVRAWTGLPTPRGPMLGAFALLWLAARITSMGGVPYLVHAALDVALLPLVAVALLRVLLQAKNRRNLPLIGILMLLALVNLAFHLSALELIDWPALYILHAALALIVMIECVIGGRVIPLFTANATGLKLKLSAKFDHAVLAVTALALLSWVVRAEGAWTVAVLALAALLQLARQLRWAPWRTLGKPILWILHFAYAWIPLGLALLASAQAGVMGESAAIHAFGVGATAGLIIGMITRTARGHTARPLKAGALEIAAYALMLLAALVRVFYPLVVPAETGTALVLAAIGWCLAFALYLVQYTPWLLAPRLDGKDG